MSRRHSKQHTQKQPVSKVIIKPAVQSKEREVHEVPAGTEGAIAIRQEDGTEKFFVVRFKIVTPEVAKFIAEGPTTTRGKVSPRKPKGKKESK